MNRRSLPIQSNKANFTDEVLVSDETGAIDNSLVNEVIVRVHDDDCVLLEAKKTDASLTGSNPYTFNFSASRMGSLCNRTYQFSVIVTVSGVTIQTHLCDIPIVDG